MESCLHCTGDTWCLIIPNTWISTAVGTVLMSRQPAFCAHLPDTTEPKNLIHSTASRCVHSVQAYIVVQYLSNPVLWHSQRQNLVPNMIWLYSINVKVTKKSELACTGDTSCIDLHCSQGNWVSFSFLGHSSSPCIPSCPEDAGNQCTQAQLHCSPLPPSWHKIWCHSSRGKALNVQLSCYTQGARV